MSRPTVWRDRDGDLWVFSANGADAWVLEPLPEPEWLYDSWSQHQVEEAYGPLIAVDLPDGAPELPPGAGQ